MRLLASATLAVAVAAGCATGGGYADARTGVAESAQLVVDAMPVDVFVMGAEDRQAATQALIQLQLAVDTLRDLKVRPEDAACQQQLVDAGTAVVDADVGPLAHASMRELEATLERC